MKIMISTPWFEPASLAGGPVRSISNMIRELSGKFRFDVFCGAKDVDGRPLEIAATDQWLDYGKDCEVFYSLNKPVVHFKKSLSTRENGCIYIVGIFSWRFTLMPLFFNSGKRVIISPRGMLHPPALAQKPFKKKVYLFLLKPFLKWKKVSFHATDAAEAEYIRRYAGADSKLFIVPNFPEIFDLMPVRKEMGKLNLVTIALIGPMKNHLLVLKALRQCKGVIDYVICGPVYVKDYWRQCEELIGELPSNIKVRYAGVVPSDQVKNILKSAHVFICPSKSENYGHAIIEALSAGKPVITSHNTPWQRLEENKAGINSETNKDALAHAIDYFAGMDDTAYSEWIKGAGDYARRQVDADSIRKEYEKMFVGEKSD
jgi:glycosyltransferase involved in cell wall biosynthesis